MSLVFVTHTFFVAASHNGANAMQCCWSCVQHRNRHCCAERADSLQVTPASRFAGLPDDLELHHIIVNDWQRGVTAEQNVVLVSIASVSALLCFQ